MYRPSPSSTLSASSTLSVSASSTSSARQTRLFATLISARHCPGSNMFAFKEVKPDPSKKVRYTLYTGDFTLHPYIRKDIQTLQKRIICRYPSYNYSTRGIWDRVYYDDTFQKFYRRFPSFHETVQVCSQLIRSICIRQRRSLFFDIRTFGHEVVVLKALNKVNLNLRCDDHKNRHRPIQCFLDINTLDKPKLDSLMQLYTSLQRSIDTSIDLDSVPHIMLGNLSHMLKMVRETSSSSSVSEWTNTLRKYTSRYHGGYVKLSTKQFLCPRRRNQVYFIKKNDHPRPDTRYIFYATHPNHSQIQQFKHLLKVKRTQKTFDCVPCNFKIAEQDVQDICNL